MGRVHTARGCGPALGGVHQDCRLLALGPCPAPGTVLARRAASTRVFSAWAGAIIPAVSGRSKQGQFDNGVHFLQKLTIMADDDRSTCPARIRSITALRPSRSRLFVGSSSNRKSGSAKIRIARAARLPISALYHRAAHQSAALQFAESCHSNMCGDPPSI